MKSYYISILLCAIFLFIDYVKCSCDVRCLKCSTDGICNECMKDYVLDSIANTCRSKCQNNTYRDDTTGKCLSVCPSSYYNDNNLLSCIKYPDCPNLLEKGQNHFDLIKSVGVVKSLIFVSGENTEDPVKAKSIKVYTRENAELSGQLLEHNDPIIGVFSGNHSDIEEVYSYSSTEIVQWDVKMGQKIRKVLFDQKLKATSISYIDLDLILLQGEDQQFGVFFLDQIRKGNPTPISILFNNPELNSIKGFARYKETVYTYTLDGKLFSYNTTAPYEKKLICSLSNAIERARAFSEKSIIIRYGKNLLAYYNGVTCVEVNVGHDQVIERVLTDKDEVTGNQYIFSLDSKSIRFSIVNSVTKSIENVTYRNIKKCYSKVMKEYLITIDVSGFFIMYKYNNKVLYEALSKNLEFKSYFQISDVYIGLTSNQVYIFGTELLYLVLDLTKVDKKIDLQNRIKNIPRAMVKHTNKVNGVVFDSQYGRVVTYSDDGSIIFYDQIRNTYKLVMQKYYPSSDCNMLENIRCYKGVLDLQILKPLLYAALYSDNTIILWEYSFNNFSVKKTLTLTDNKSPILNMFFLSDGKPETKYLYLAYCNAKEIRVYNNETEQDDVIYTPSDIAKFGFLHCAVDVSNGVLYVIGTRLKDATKLTIFTIDFPSLKSTPPNLNIPATQMYDVNQVFFIAQYFPLQKWYMVTTSELKLYFANFPNFSVTTPLIIQQNLPVSVAFDTTTRDMTVFSKNQYITFFQYSNGAYTKQLTYQFTAIVSGKQSTVISNPKLFFYFQNTGVNTIQNQVFVVRENLNFQLVLTFEDKISSLNVDTTAKKLYIGFENGKVYSGYYIENYLLYTSLTVDFISFHYSDSTDTLFAFKRDIYLIDTTKLEVIKVLSDTALTTDLTGIRHIRETNELLAYSASTLNLVKWNLAIGTYQTFKGGHTGGVVDVQLDKNKNIMVSTGTDFFFIVWNYIDMTEIYRISEHVNAKKDLDIREVDQYPEFKTVFKILLFIIDIDNKVIITANNLSQIYVHNYNLRTNMPQSAIAITNVVADTKYRHVIASSSINFVYKLIVYEYTSISFSYLRDIQLHTEQIKGIVIQNDNIYSFEDTKIIIMDRSTLFYKQTIVCVNPLITNFIIYEKLNQVIIWSDGTLSSTYLNQSIGIYHLITGNKIVDINNNQSIEQGNIHLVTIDEDASQLIISKTYTKNFIYTVDLKTFYYTGYYTTHYTSPLKKWQYIPRTNRIIFIDSTVPSSTLSIYNMEGSINQRNNIELITDEKNKNNFMDENNNNVYYIDAMNQSWQYNLDTNKLQFKNQYLQVKASRFIRTNFYLVTAEKAFMFTKELLSTGEFVLTSINQVYFTDYYLFMTDFSNTLYQLELSSFNQISKRSLEAPILQFISVEPYSEIVILTTAQRVFRLHTLNQTSWFYLKQDNLTNIFIDVNSPSAFIHVINSTKLQFFSYSQNIAFNLAEVLFTIDNVFKPFRIVFDLTYKQFIVTSISDRVPIINIYSYTNTTTNVLQLPVLKKQLPSPSRSVRLFIDITDPLYIQIMLPWEIVYYDRTTYLFVKYFRDTQVIYSRQSISTVDNFPNLLNSVQNDSIQFYQLSDSIFKQPSLFKFSLSYPVILQYKVTQKSIYYQIRLIGVSSYFIFEYDFQIPIQFKGITPVFDSCYYPFEGTYNYIVIPFYQIKLKKLSLIFFNSKFAEIELIPIKNKILGLDVNAKFVEFHTKIKLLIEKKSN